MKYIFLIFVALLCSCGMETENQSITEKEGTHVRTHTWVCHNPQAAMHGSRCTEKVDPTHGPYEACHWILDGSSSEPFRRAQNSFCWLLETRDCEGTIEYQWQKDSCHLLED